MAVDVIYRGVCGDVLVVLGMSAGVLAGRKPLPAPVAVLLIW